MSSTPKAKMPKTTNKKRKKRNAKNKRMIRTKAIPMAIATTQRKPYFRRLNSKNNEQEIIIEGEDLVIPTPNALPTQATSSDLFLTIPANPLYWTGTRISGVANVYQQYRPLKFEVEYIPQVPVTVPGQVIMGTLWNNGSPAQSLQQTLMSSNGGRMTQCYKPCRSNVICNRTTLPLNQYNIHDDLALNTSNPFIWAAHYSGAWVGGSTPTTNQPGWVYIRWKYLFSIGLGNRGYSVKVYNELSEQQVTNSPFTAGWGIVLSYLKSYGLPILRKVAIVLIREVLATLTATVSTNDKPKSVTLPVGSIYTVSPEELLKPEVVIKGSDGVSYTISADNRACVYMEGDEVVSGSEPPGPALNYAAIKAKDYPKDENYLADIQYQGEEISSVTIYINRPDTTTTAYYQIGVAHELYYYAIDLNFSLSIATNIYFDEEQTSYMQYATMPVPLRLRYMEGQCNLTDFLVWAESLGVAKVQDNNDNNNNDELQSIVLGSKQQPLPKDTIIFSAKKQPPLPF